MNERREPTDAGEPSDHALDELLCAARWPGMDPAAEQRLRGTWRESFDRPRHAWRPVALAAAAALACAALAGWWLLQRTDVQRHLVTTPAAEAVQPVVLLAPIPRGEARDPTPLERLLVNPTRGAARVPSTAPSRATDTKPQVDERARVRSMLASRDARDLDAFLQLVLGEATRDVALRTLREAEEPPVDALLAQLANPRVDRRFAAARALGEVCEPAVVERLWGMVRRDVYRREALAALTQCHNPRAGRLLAVARGDPGLESQLRSVRQQMERIF